MDAGLAPPRVGLTGTLNEINAFNGVPDTTANILAHLDEIGVPNSFPRIPVGWALAGDTPFQWTKQVASHYGGIKQKPMEGVSMVYAFGDATNKFTGTIEKIVLTITPPPPEVQKDEERQDAVIDEGIN
jgi:hypothetical protein